MDKIIELHRKLNDANDKYYKLGGAGKVSDGLVSYEIILNPRSYEEDPIHIIKIYSYIFGPSRMHEFKGKTFDEAFNKASSEFSDWLRDFDWDNA